MNAEQSEDGKTRSTPTAAPEAGVLAALPRTRPQRASARRAAARARTQSETAPKRKSAGAATVSNPAEEKPKPVKRKAAKPAPAKSTQSRPKATPKRKPPRASSTRQPAQERAPKQGYEPEEEVEIGATVHPPSGSELIESLADIFGELASAGANAGGRLLKDALSVLRRP